MQETHSKHTQIEGKRIKKGIRQIVTKNKASTDYVNKKTEQLFILKYKK